MVAAPELERTANHEPPRAPRQVMQHRQAGTTQGEPEPEQVADQVSREKVDRRDCPGHQTEKKPCATRNQRSVLELVQSGPQLLIGRHVGAHGRLPSS